MKTEIIAPTTASDEGLVEVATLLSAVFRRKRSWLDELRWEYLEHPRGPAWWVNVRSDDGTLIGHSALLPTSPLDDPRFEHLPVWFSLNTAVRPDATQPGLMVAGIRALLQKVEAEQPAIVLGVANAKSAAGFTRLLKFDFLGPLSLTLLAPWSTPTPSVRRAVRLEMQTLKWRAARPGTDTYCAAGAGAVFRRVTHFGCPLDGVLTVRAPEFAVTEAALPRRPRSSRLPAPRLYASFGAPPGRGLRVPDALRPSPLNYICRSLAKEVDRAVLVEFLAARGFEFIDFDVL